MEPRALNTADFLPLLTTVLTAMATGIVAAVISYIAGRGMKNHEWKLELTKERILAREHLYADFLALVSDQSLHAMDEKISKAADLSGLMEKNERIALVASQPVVDGANAICAALLDANGKNAETPFDGFFDLKQTFIREVRRELSDLYR